MQDNDCVTFLQWALPHLKMRWPGFRKVRGQVCKRIGRRLADLGISSLRDYQLYLRTNPEEWFVLDGLCRITISRFYRDKMVFAVLEEDVLPELIHRVRSGGEQHLRFWSAGCASGEEPYTLALLWTFGLREHFPDTALQILATDSDPGLLERARKACYPRGSVKDLPEAWRENAFQATDGSCCLHERFREMVTFRRHDIRRESPPGPFHLILCRNLVFTYFTEEVQRAFLAKIGHILADRGILLIGNREKLPENRNIFDCSMSRYGIYLKA